MIKEIISTKEFLEETQSGTVIVDFYSQTCQPCKQLATNLHMLDEELGDDVKILKIDANEIMELTSDFSVSSVPTVFKLVDGEVADKFTGARPTDFLIDWIK